MPVQSLSWFAGMRPRFADEDATVDADCLLKEMALRVGGGLEVIGNLGKGLLKTPVPALSLAPSFRP